MLVPTIKAFNKIENIHSLKNSLYYHIYHPVKWFHSIKYMIDNGINTFIEVGYSNQLSKFVKYINRRVKVFQTTTVQDFEKVLSVFGH